MAKINTVSASTATASKKVASTSTASKKVAAPKAPKAEKVLTGPAKVADALIEMLAKGTLQVETIQDEKVPGHKTFKFKADLGKGEVAFTAENEVKVLKNGKEQAKRSLRVFDSKLGKDRYVEFGYNKIYLARLIHRLTNGFKNKSAADRVWDKDFTNKLAADIRKNKANYTMSATELVGKFDKASIKLEIGEQVLKGKAGAKAVKKFKLFADGVLKAEGCGLHKIVHAFSTEAVVREKMTKEAITAQMEASVGDLI